MKLNELIEKLQEFENNGYGDNQVVVCYYSEIFDPSPEIFDDKIVL